MSSSHPTRVGAQTRRPRPPRLVPALVAVLISLPGLAHPISLSHLLRLPMEELLRLEITGATPTPRSRPPSSFALPAPLARSTR